MVRCFQCCHRFLIGPVAGWERQTTALPEDIRLFLTVGVFGGLSTFSTFNMETVSYIEGAHYLKAGLNTLLNVGLSLAFVFAGLMFAKLLK